MLEGPNNQLKQIIQIEHKNPTWQEANQLAIYKRGQGFELGATEKQIQVMVRAGLEPGTAGLQVQHADHSTTLPPACFLLDAEYCIVLGMLYNYYIKLQDGTEPCLKYWSVLIALKFVSLHKVFLCDTSLKLTLDHAQWVFLVILY